MANDKRIPAARIRKVWMDSTISGAEAARRVGLTRVNLWLRAKALGLPQRRRAGKPVSMPPEEFRAMWCAGVRPSDISAHFGVSKIGPWQTAQRMGLPGWPPGAPRISLYDFRQQQLAARIAQGAAETRAALAARRREEREWLREAA